MRLRTPIIYVCVYVWNEKREGFSYILDVLRQPSDVQENYVPSTLLKSRSLHLTEAESRARLFAEVIKPAVTTPECRPPSPNTRTDSRVFVWSFEVNGFARPGRGAPKPPRIDCYIYCDTFSIYSPYYRI